MSDTNDDLLTPVHIKTTQDSPLAVEEPVAYLLSSSGLFICRNHRLFSSCVPARGWPTELASHRSSLLLRHPLIPREQFERLVGFFSRVGSSLGVEAAALILWDSETDKVNLHIPEQVAAVTRTWDGQFHPIDLHYDIPMDLPGNVSVVGDIHSHADLAAYASHADKLDEQHSPGAHIVVGRVSREPPEFHCEYVTDGSRFEIDILEIVEAYEGKRNDFPDEWTHRLKIETLEPYSGGSKSGHVYQSYKPARQAANDDDFPE